MRYMIDYWLTSDTRKGFIRKFGGETLNGERVDVLGGKTVLIGKA